MFSPCYICHIDISCLFDFVLSMDPRYPYELQVFFVQVICFRFSKPSKRKSHIVLRSDTCWRNACANFISTLSFRFCAKSEISFGVQTALGVVENCKIFKGLCLLRLLMVSHSAHLIAPYIGEERPEIETRLMKERKKKDYLWIFELIKNTRANYDKANLS